MPKMTHDLDLVERHCTERVIDVAVSVRRVAQIPIASQIGDVDRILLGQNGCYLVPGNVAFGKSMQKVHRRSIAFVNNRDGRSTGMGTRPVQSWEKAPPPHSSTASVAVRVKIPPSSRHFASPP